MELVLNFVSLWRWYSMQLGFLLNGMKYQSGYYTDMVYTVDFLFIHTEFLLKVGNWLFLLAVQPSVTSYFPVIIHQNYQSKFFSSKSIVFKRQLPLFKHSFYQVLWGYICDIFVSKMHSFSKTWSFDVGNDHLE